MNNQDNFSGKHEAQDRENHDGSHDEIGYHGELTSLDETLISNTVPHGVAWRGEWRSWVGEIRAALWNVCW